MLLAAIFLGSGCPKEKAEVVDPIKALGDSIYVNAGGGAFVDSSGNTWLADVNFNTGTAFSTSAPIAGSTDGQPYQSERWDSPSGAELMYSFILDPGFYQVRLHFAEIYSGASQVGQRVFDVLIEGQVVLDDFDMIADSGFQTAIVKEFGVTLTDGTLNIQLVHGVENPKISGIEIIEGASTAPVLDVSPASLSYGDVQVGASAAPQTVTLSNTGDATLNVSGVSFQGANAADFSSDAASGYAIDPGMSANFDVTFAPLNAGARSANLVVISDDSNSPASVPLSGTGRSPVANVSPSPVDFGDVFTGESSAATTITLSNPGNQTLNVSSISFTGTNPGDFQSTAAATYTIAPAASETFDVTFTPAAGGARSAQLSIVSDDPSSPTTTSLSGNGVVPQPPTANVSPLAIDFGAVTIDTTSAAQGVMISNTGHQVLEVSGVSVSGDFGTNASATYSIPPGGSASFNATFTPTSEGALAGQIDITSNDPGGVASVLLSGQGQLAQPPTAVLNPSAHDFGTITVSESSSPVAVVLSNTGDDTLEVTSVSLGGADAGEFSTDAASSYSIPAGESIGFSVAFNPTASGASTASLSVVSNDPNSPAVLALSGTGTDLIPTTFYRINAGGGAYVDPSGNTWGADNPYVNTGSTFTSAVAIAGTDLDPLFQSERWDSVNAPELMYTLPVDPGEYTVRLYFAEIFSGAADIGERVFNVNVEGNPFLTNFDIFATAGFATATIQETTVQVNDGNLNVQLTHVTENPKISAIEVLGNVAGVPVLSASPTSIDCGSVDVGVQSAPTTVTLSNIGAVTLQVTGVQLVNPVGGTFATNALQAYSIAPSSSVTFDVTLTPDAPGIHTASLEITSNDSASPASLSLTGEGVASGGPQFTVSPSSVAFGTVNVGSTTAATTVMVTNDDAVAHDLESISVGGANAGDFQLSGLPGLPMTLAAGQSASVGVAFSPGATGARNGQLTFSFDGGAFTEVASLSGTGQTAPPPPPTGSALYRINAGGPAYTDTFANAWQADAMFNSGKTYVTSNAIAGTTDDTLYQSERWDLPDAPELMYNLPIASGSYDLRLHFAETYSGNAGVGKRVFNVLVEGQPALTNYDIFAKVGFETATVESIPVNVADGSLDIQFIHVTENPKISAIEVVTSGGLESDIALLEWGHVGIGATGSVMNATLTNTGDVDATISSLSFNVNGGVGHDFHATLDSVAYAGAEGNVQHATNVVVPVGDSIVVPIQFLPTEAGDNDVNLVFGGNFGSVVIRVLGSGGEDSGHPFLHVVIVADPYVVDFDGNGSESVNLIGSYSHTHEIGHNLAAFEWTENGTPFSAQADLTTPFPVGDHTVTLTIFDNNVPAETLSGSETFKVVAADAIPGVLAQYYTAGGLGGANVYLDTVPANAEFAETLPNGYNVVNQSGTIGGSPYATYVMVQMLGNIQIDTAGQYAFVANGGNETRVFVDGVLHTGAQALTPGQYDLEARFAVNSVGELPLTVTYGIDGGPQMAIDPLILAHDQSVMKPVINSMPSSGLEIGGATINIQGLGFIPLDQVTVHWGGSDFSGNDLTVSATQISLVSPPGVNTVQVTVETPNGVSNPMNYTYNSTGPAPVQFDLSDMITGLTDPTAATLGADGRLYVSELDGTIFAYTFDDDYNVTDTQTITTFESVTNMHVLGLETNPTDPPGVVRIYVAHSQLFANGADCFTGFSPYSGQVSIVTGPNFDTIQPIATGLPVSNHDHGVSGMAFDDNGDLYVCVGGNTNAGVLGCNLGGLDESPLSASILRLRLNMDDYNGTVIYKDPATCLSNNDQVFGESVNLAHGVDIDVFAFGMRNSFDIEYTTKGRLYATDNGPNQGFGAESTGPNSQGPDPFDGDELNLIDVGRYYGSPNRNRGREDERQNIYRERDVATIPGEYEQPVTEFGASTNGLIEYRAQTFNSAMRGDLVAQRWNAATYRVGLTEDGKSTNLQYNMFTTFTGLNLIGAPGGVILGIDLTSGSVMKAVPDDIAASGLTLYDIHPWRAPATGGQEFNIGGANFGTLGNTSVTIGGKPATLTYVSSTRIKGIIPSSNVGAGPDMLDLVVTVGPASVTMTEAFRYLRSPGEDSGSQATMVIDPGGNINESSTYGYGSFNLSNESTNGQKITRMRLDISSAIMPDSVFDPYGLAGDPIGKDFTLDNGNVGVTSNTWFAPNGGGFDTLEVTFDDFQPGETLRFSADIDPTNVKGAPDPGPNHSASISGMDLTGAHLRVEFDDGSVQEGTLFRSPGSDTGSRGTVFTGAPPEAEIEVVGVCSPAILSNANQTVTVYGPQGYGVRLIVVESAFYLQGVPNGGFDIDPFEYNTALSITEHTATIDGSGSAQIPVTLTNSGQDAGYNVISAVLVDAQGNEGPVSQTLVLQLD